MIKGLKCSVVVDDSTSMARSHMWAQHGLSILVEAEMDHGRVMNILVDAGTSPEVLLHNLDLMGIEPGRLDLIFLSHGHYDHTGGLISVLGRTGRRVPVAAHPAALAPKMVSRPFLRYIGVPFTAEEVESAGAVMILSRGAMELGEGILSTGEVERSNAWETVEGFVTIDDGTLVEDRVIDDQALVVSLEGKGLVVITGCAHSGIINTIQHAQRLSGVSDLYAVIGGFHLVGAGEERLAATVEALKDMDPELVMPGHCTGTRAVCRLMQAFGERCRPLSAGEVLRL